MKLLLFPSSNNVSERVYWFPFLLGSRITKSQRSCHFSLHLSRHKKPLMISQGHCLDNCYRPTKKKTWFVPLTPISAPVFWKMMSMVTGISKVLDPTLVPYGWENISREDAWNRTKQINFLLGLTFLVINITYLAPIVWKVALLSAQLSRTRTLWSWSRHAVPKQSFDSNLSIASVSEDTVIHISIPITAGTSSELGEAFWRKGILPMPRLTQLDISPLACPRAPFRGRG